MSNISSLVHKRQYLLILVCAALSFLFSQCASVRSNTAGEAAPGAAKQMPDRSKRKLLLRDEGLSQLSYVDLADSTNNWYVKVPAGRDLQLIGRGRVLIGTGAGYEEREIATGNKVSELTLYEGTISATRLRNGNTLLTGVNWQGKQGIILLEVDKNGNIKNTIHYPGFAYVRLVRQTMANTFLVVANDTVFEGTTEGKIMWGAKISGRQNPHAWQAVRLANGQTIVSAGYGANFQVFGTDGKPALNITGPKEVNPNFFSGFQVLANGNYVVANWQGHGPTFGASGNQVLEYTPGGEMAWSWKQDPGKFSSLQGVIVLDGLDLNFLHVENASGILEAVQ